MPIKCAREPRASRPLKKKFEEGGQKEEPNGPFIIFELSKGSHGMQNELARSYKYGGHAWNLCGVASAIWAGYSLSFPTFRIFIAIVFRHFQIIIISNFSAWTSIYTWSQRASIPIFVVYFATFGVGCAVTLYIRGNLRAFLLDFMYSYSSIQQYRQDKQSWRAHIFVECDDVGCSHYFEHKLFLWLEYTQFSFIF